MTDQANYRWWLIQMRMYVGWWISNYTFWKEFVRSVLWCFNALQYTFRVPQRSRDALGKKTLWQGCKYSNVLPRIFRNLSLVRKPFGFLPLRSQTANDQQGSSLTLRNPFSSADLANAVSFSGWWHHQFVIKYEKLEVKHGALEKKPIFQPNHTSEHLRKPPLNQGQQIKMQHV